MKDWLKRFLPFVSLLALCVVIAALEPKFLSVGNLTGVARQTAVITIMAMGMTLVMVAGVLRVLDPGLLPSGVSHGRICENNGIARWVSGA